jgi:uncharacterized lipoprotein YehR (DUF1307 family)
MNKIKLFFVILIVIFLQGCAENNIQNNFSILGSWQGGSINGTITFYEDNMIEVSSIMNVSFFGVYDTIGNSIFVNLTDPFGGYSEYEMRYNFLDNSTVEFAYVESGLKETYTRIG